MTSNPSFVVKCFRQELEVSSFRLGLASDPELESWLFEPGPDRLNLLQWCLLSVAVFRVAMKKRLRNVSGVAAYTYIALACGETPSPVYVLCLQALSNMLRASG